MLSAIRFQLEKALSLVSSVMLDTWDQVLGIVTASRHQLLSLPAQEDLAGHHVSDSQHTKSSTAQPVWTPLHRGFFCAFEQCDSKHTECGQCPLADCRMEPTEPTPAGRSSPSQP
ncbi:hypothetical protein NMY22_g19014 [Coprinellus aureogranulatus]|nr:hypothetical protein NMY22_g19014 [Coprinellus aureogranulatus]